MLVRFYIFTPLGMHCFQSWKIIASFEPAKFPFHTLYILNLYKLCQWPKGCWSPRSIFTFLRNIWTSKLTFKIIIKALPYGQCWDSKWKSKQTVLLLHLLLLFITDMTLKSPPKVLKVTNIASFFIWTVF